jgi:hypothetical protein
LLSTLLTKDLKFKTLQFLKDKTWLPDISQAINGDLFEIADQYFELNPDVDKKQVRNAFSN